MANIVSRSSGSDPVPADDDNRYKAVQAKLARLSAAMDDAALELGFLRRDMKGNAADADRASSDIENAGLDAKFSVLTDDVAVALGLAARQVSHLDDSAQEVVTLAHQAKRTHADLYGALDDIRSNRREKTPKPGFFNR
ncbi:conjugal transfer protein TraB [Streptomyces sp. NPDC001787]|uniref:conjugal transfer protein TraB n=1 Tax=Streptomyces sp. NPDC001787 TaxID=3154523 RepID=UPI003333DAAF